MFSSQSPCLLVVGPSDIGTVHEMDAVACTLPTASHSKVSPGKYFLTEPKQSPRPLLKGQVADDLSNAVHQLAHPWRAPEARLFFGAAPLRLVHLSMNMQSQAEPVRQSWLDDLDELDSDTDVHDQVGTIQRLELDPAHKVQHQTCQAGR